MVVGGWVCILIGSGSYLAVIVPLLVHSLPSGYFILFFSSLELVLCYALIWGILWLHQQQTKSYAVLGEADHIDLGQGEADQTKSGFFSQEKLLIQSGTCNAFSSLCLTYASNPTKTPVILQGLLLGLVICFSICLTKWYLRKSVRYHVPYLCVSLGFLVVGIVVGSLPALFGYGNGNGHDGGHDNWQSGFLLLWISVYIAGTFLLALEGILQERYFRKYIMVDHNKFERQIRAVLIIRVSQFMVISCLFWSDCVVNWQDWNTVRQQFRASMVIGFSDPSYRWWFQSFILLYVVRFLSAVFLNKHSTNLSMMASLSVAPCAMLFFQVFPSYNPGASSSWGITLGALACYGLSVLAFRKAEIIAPMEEGLLL